MCVFECNLPHPRLVQIVRARELYGPSAVLKLALLVQPYAAPAQHSLMTMLPKGRAVLQLLLGSIVLAAKVACGFNLHATSTRSAQPAQTRHCTMNTASFRTEVHVPLWPEHTQLGYEDSFFLLGSCFSENIGGRLFRAKLPASVNPSHGG